MLILINTCHQTTLACNKEPISVYFPLHVYKFFSTSDTSIASYKETLINQFVLSQIHRKFY